MARRETKRMVGKSIYHPLFLQESRT